MITSSRQEPLYQSLANRLRQRIHTGEAKPGDRVGSEHDLVRTESVSRMTVRRASDLLIKEGLIERRPGKGLFVRHHDTVLYTVQVLAGNLRWEPALQASRGVTAAARDLQITPLLYDAHGDVEHDLKMVRNLPRAGVDGAVIVSLHGQAFGEATQALRGEGFPFVLVDQRLADPHVPSVIADNYQGGRAVGQHLLAHGHRRFGFIGDIVADTVHARLQGYRDAIEAAGLHIEPQHEVDLDAQLGRLSDWSPEIQKATAQLMGSDEPPTAIFGSCDAIACAVVKNLKEIGLSVPADVSVVGFDDDPISQWMTPQLTSVKQPFFEMGRVALNLLHQQLSSPGLPIANVQQSLPVTLVQRESVASIDHPTHALPRPAAAS